VHNRDGKFSDPTNQHVYLSRNHGNSSGVQFGYEENYPYLSGARVELIAGKSSISGSRNESTAFSDLLRIAENDRALLLGHQEEWRRVEEQCDERIEALSRMIKNSGQNVQPKAPDRVGKKKKRLLRGTNLANGAQNVAVKKRTERGLRVGDETETQPCSNDSTTRQHRLSEDARVPCGKISSSP
jgi:hypothetical protein